MREGSHSDTNETEAVVLEWRVGREEDCRQKGRREGEEDKGRGALSAGASVAHVRILDSRISSLAKAKL